MKARKCRDYSFEGSCEHDNELTGFIKVRGFLNQQILSQEVLCSMLHGVH
jgi:hypothetical protein